MSFTDFSKLVPKVFQTTSAFRKTCVIHLHTKIFIYLVNLRTTAYNKKKKCYKLLNELDAISSTWRECDFAA